MFALAPFFQALLALYCASGLVAFNAPLLAAALFLFARASLPIAAYMHVPSFWGSAFFLPALVVLFAQVGVALGLGKVRFRINRVLASYLLFVASTGLIGLGFMLAGADAAKNGEEISKYMLPMALYVLVYTGIRHDKDLEKATKFLALASLLPIAAGLVEFILNIGFDYDTLSFTPGYRPAGTIIDPNLYGIYLALNLFLALPRVLHDKPKKLDLLYVLSVLLAIVVAKNRGTWIAVFFAFAVGVWLFRRYLRVGRWVMGALAVILLALPIMLARFGELNDYDQWGQKKDTAEGRYEYVVALLEKTTESPLFGRGAGSFDIGVFGANGKPVPPHNDYVRVACQYGFPAMFLYVFFLGSQFRWVVRHRRDRLWRYQFAACACQIYLIVISLAQNVLTDMVDYGLIFSMMAISHRASAFSGTDGKEPVRNLLRRQDDKT